MNSLERKILYLHSNINAKTMAIESFIAVKNWLFECEIFDE